MGASLLLAVVSGDHPAPAANPHQTARLGQLRRTLKPLAPVRRLFQTRLARTEGVKPAIEVEHPQHPTVRGKRHLRMHHNSGTPLTDARQLRVECLSVS